MRKIYPKLDDARIVKKFAWFPTSYSFDDAGRYIRIWLESYYMYEVRSFTIGFLDGYTEYWKPTRVFLNEEMAYKHLKSMER
jgi:hypothetical protein